MYSTCIFCHRDLGSNQVIEAFPIGRRIAFDGEKGRLWAVCRACGRWNLSALEERWEAIEQCERIFRATNLKSSTENIGLARAGDGTDLVRIGRPQPLEFAAWRYGDQFGRRFRRNLILSTVGIGVSVSLLATGAYPALFAAIPGSGFLIQVPTWVNLYRRRRLIVAKSTVEGGTEIVIRGKHLPSACLVATEDHGSANWSLRVSHDLGETDLRGSIALRTASKILARLNRMGAGSGVVRSAMERLNGAGGSAAVFERIASNPQKETSGWLRWWSGVGADGADDPAGTLRSLKTGDRLALEMATHEESERRALENELQDLEAEWRQAEEIAAIADSLMVPASVQEFVRKHESKHVQ